VDERARPRRLVVVVMMVMVVVVAAAMAMVVMMIGHQFDLRGHYVRPPRCVIGLRRPQQGDRVRDRFEQLGV